MNYEDADANGLPIGLHSYWLSGLPSNGSLQLRLMHQPGTKNNSITTGETDLDLSFAVQVH